MPRSNHPAKQAVYDYYERHRSEFKSKADAAYRIHEQRIAPVKYSTIYSWLDAYLRSSLASEQKYGNAG